MIFERSNSERGRGYRPEDTAKAPAEDFFLNEAKIENFEKIERTNLQAATIPPVKLLSRCTFLYCGHTDLEQNPEIFPGKLSK